MPYITEYVYRPAPKPLKSRLATWLLLLLFILAFVLVTMPFWPAASYTVSEVWPGHQTTIAKAQAEAYQPTSPGPGNWLLIPSIDVKTPLVEGEDVGILDRENGVWHQTGQPTQGNFVIAGHRFKYLPPNQTTLFNLDKLKSDDLIVVWFNEQRYTYTVEQSFTVKRDAIEILNPTPQAQLTLYTCTDLNASKRLVVIGALVESKEMTARY